MTFDSTSVFGNQRSKRYALTVENGKVTGTYIEPDNTGVNGMHILITSLRLLLTCISLHGREGPWLNALV